jgi:beta-lactamase class A
VRRVQNPGFRCNLLLRSFGDPPGLTAYARLLGDEVTRLDRFETELNEAKPGDPRDTTTPSANLGKIVLGNPLSKVSCEQIRAWLRANTTGNDRIRAGMPKDWTVGDRTGTSTNGVTNDVGVVWPPERAPIIVSAYIAESPASSDERNVLLKEIGRIVATAV